MSDPCAKKYDTPAGFAVRKGKVGYEAMLTQDEKGAALLLEDGFKTENMANLYLHGIVKGVLIGMKAQMNA